MKIRFLYFTLLAFMAFAVAGCCTTEERLANFGDSVHNIALDGDGIN